LFTNWEMRRFRADGYRLIADGCMPNRKPSANSGQQSAVGGRPMGYTITLHSPFSPQECEVRLSAAIDAENLATSIQFLKPLFSGSKIVAGGISRDRIRLRIQSRYWNSIQHILVGTLRPAENGTLFCGTFGVHALVRISIIMACILGATIFVVSVAACLAGWVSQDEAIGGAFIAPLAVGYLLLSVKVSEVRALEEREDLIRFLTETLEAKSNPVPMGHSKA
jgi:hypothetical protein